MYYFVRRCTVFSLVFFLVGCDTLPGPTNQNNGFLAFTPPSQKLSLAQEVQNALIRSGDPVIAQAHVQANQSHILLTGYVKKIRQSDMAEQLTRKVPGVTSVENRLIVRQ